MLEMTEAEIITSYQTAKSKTSQIKILADLNETTPKEIKRILARKGVLSEKPKEVKHEIPTPVFKACNERIAVLNGQIETCNQEIERLAEEINKSKLCIDRLESEKQEIVDFIQK